MKQFILFLFLASVTGFSSCSKGGCITGESGNGETGSLSISYGFEVVAPATYAAVPSTAKPTTSWKKNIRDLLILFAKDGVIKDSRELIFDQTLETAGEQKSIITNIVAGQGYTVYLVANARQAVNANNLGFTGLKGENVMRFLLQAATTTPVPAAANGVIEHGYEEAPELFLAVQENIDVIADSQTALPVPFNLTRIVSLFRVRINQSEGKALAANKGVKFDVPQANLRIRRTAMGVNLTSAAPYCAYSPAYDAARPGKLQEYLTFVSGAFKNTDPAAGDGYTGTVIDNAGGFKIWRDVMIFPGGARDSEENAGKKKFDIVLMGLAPAGYIPQGQTTALTEPALVAWTGAVGGSIAANKILEVNLTLESAGIRIDPDNPEIPEPGSYGNLSITCTLADWGNIESVDIPL